MANGFYKKGLEAFLSGSISWSSHDIKVVLVDTAGYTVNLSTHQYLSDIGAGYRIATSGNLAGKSVTDGVADASDATITAVTGASVEALVIYKDTGNTATSPLICYIDTMTGLPFTPNGSDVTITWNNGADKILKLG